MAAYTKTTWSTGDTITAALLNHAETQYDCVHSQLGNNTSDMWTQIKAADGAGSGLNADQLDGDELTTINSRILVYSLIF